MKNTGLPAVIASGVLALSSPFSASQANGTTDSVTVSASNQRPETPLMVWRGVFEFGFLRVELWSRPMPGQPISQDLVVKSVSPGYSITYSGLMVPMPADVKTEPNVRQMYIRVSDDSVRSDIRYPSIVATLCSDGTLHLYECGSNYLNPPCVLRPVE